MEENLSIDELIFSTRVNMLDNAGIPSEDLIWGVPHHLTQIISEICFFSWFVLFSLQHQQRQCLPQYLRLEANKEEASQRNTQLSTIRTTYYVYERQIYIQIKLGLRVSLMTKSQPLGDQRN